MLVHQHVSVQALTEDSETAVSVSKLGIELCKIQRIHAAWDWNAKPTGFVVNYDVRQMMYHITRSPVKQLSQTPSVLMNE